MAEQKTRNVRNIRVYRWFLILAVAGLWRCVGPAQVDTTYRLCRDSGDCEQDFVCVLNACIQRPIEAIVPEPFPEIQLPENPVTPVDASEPAPPEKICPEGMPECETCVRKENCGKGRICTEQGVCIKGCVNNEDCIKPDPPYCDPKLSVCKACLSTAECRFDQPGTLCRNDVCGTCDTDDACVKEYEAGYLCIEGKCKKAECRQHTDCPKAHQKCGDECFCRANQCEPCNETGTECGSDRLCLAGKCVSGDCRQDSDCLGGKLCKQNRCTGCTGTQDCLGGQICENSACVKGQCAVRSDCPSGLLCVRGKCAGCTQDNECASGELCLQGVCQNANCRVRSDCRAGETCFNFRCGPCGQDSECESNELCLSGGCKVAQCRLRSDCKGADSGKVCKNNVCADCTSRSDCAADEICISGRCQRGNCVDTLADCGASRQVCLANACKACTQKSDCAAYKGDCVGGQCLIVAEVKNGAMEWSDGTAGLDCADYRFPSRSHVQAATSSGLYRIKPAASTNAYVVHCEMAYAGGGWTLVLKADGAQTTFEYNNALWTNQNTHPASNPDRDRNRTEAKLESYWTVPVEEILLQMQQNTTDAVRSGIVRMKASSMLDVIKKPNNTDFEAGMAIPNWRSLVGDSSLQQNCIQEGINLRISNGDLRGVRLGIKANDNSSFCSYADSAIGFGIESRVSNPPSIGNIARSGADNGNKDHKPFGYVYVRQLRSTQSVVLDDGALTYAGGRTGESCLAYHLPPAASATDGTYWIQPPGVSKRIKTYCRMLFQGGGWSLAMKVDGRKTTFSYNKPIWTDKTPLNPTLVNLTTDGEAKLENFWAQSFSQVLLSFQNPSSTGFISIMAHKQAKSLHDILSPNTYQSFDYPLGRYAWRWAMPVASLQRNCAQEGFNAIPSDANAARVRIGIIANEKGSCDGQNDSRIGVGGASDYCGQDNDNSAGNEAYCWPEGPDRSTKAFVYVFVR